MRFFDFAYLQNIFDIQQPMWQDSKYNNIQSTKQEKDSFIDRLKQQCLSVRNQLSKLRYLQFQLVKYIKTVFKQLPAQIQYLICHGNQNRSRTVKNNQKITVGNKSKHNQIKETQAGNFIYENKLKRQDSAIKISIMQKIQSLRELENKENSLRKTNQEHQSLRKHIDTKTTAGHRRPKDLTNNSSYRIQNPLNALWNQNYSQQPSIQCSPKFKINYDAQDTNASLQSSEEIAFKVHTRPFQNKNPLKFAILKCQNHHEYYQGDVKNHLPHGQGLLVNCCSYIPLKIQPNMVSYRGGFKEGFYQGEGVLHCKGNTKFIGNFQRGLRHGEGIIYLQGVGERGIWQNDRLLTYL